MFTSGEPANHSLMLWFVGSLFFGENVKAFAYHVTSMDYEDREECTTRCSKRG